MNDHDQEFKPAWWLKNQHLQTMWPRLVRRRLKAKITKERFELADGDFVDVLWAGENHHNPIVIILHGLGGELRSPYATGLINSITDKGWRAAFMYFRGAGDEPNRLARSYHSGETNDFNYIVQEIRKREPGTPLFAVGFSLGGNVLLKWLGEQKEAATIRAGVAVSVPFDLTLAANKLQNGFSRFYQWYLLSKLKRKFLQKFKPDKSPVDHRLVKRYRNFWQFDNAITAPLHGFYDAYDYYHRCSSKHYLKDIKAPTLIIHAKDDPFMTTDVIPEEHHLSSFIDLAISPNGGHVGFISGNIPGKAEFWLDKRIINYLTNNLK